MNLAWYDFVGTAGVTIILLAYFALQVERLDPQGFAYSAANFLGAALIAVSLVFEFNFSAMLIEICWMAISLIGILRIVRGRRRDALP